MTSGVLHHPLQTHWASLSCLDHPHAQISLEQCIPPPIWLRIPITDLMYLSEQLSTVQMGLAHGIDQVVKWHDATQTQFECTPLWSNELPLKYHFFTDGSSIRDPTQQGKRLGASAIVLIVQTGQGLRWGGSRTFQVDDGPTAPKTEIVAIVLALLWSIQIGDAHPHSLAPFQVSFGYDCQAAGHVAAGQWRIKAHHALQNAWTCTGVVGATSIQRSHRVGAYSQPHRSPVE